MIKRIFYTFQQGWRYRNQLRDVQRKSRDIAPVDIDINDLQQQGYQAIVFDFDGILAPHGEVAPTQPMQAILQQSLQCFGSHNVYILSNKPSRARLEYFQQHFPEIIFVTGQRKKPYPDGLLNIVTLSKVSSRKILLIDDRLLTGALAALIANVDILYIRKPLVNLYKRPLREGFFQCLRVIERMVFI